VSYRVRFLDGPFAGVEGDYTPGPDVEAWAPLWAPLVDNPGRYVLAETEPVPFELGRHPHLLLTAGYRWEPSS
jgi:hypothetical protein